MSLLIVILNHRTGSLTVDCLRSLAPAMHEVPGTRAIIIDNGSGDGSAEQIAAAIATHSWSAWATLLALPQNVGFAAGNNRGLGTLATSNRDCDWVLLLNSDTVLSPDVLRHCHAVMQADPSIGMMSCQLRNADGSLQNVTRDFPTPLKQTLCALGLPWIFPRFFGWADVYDVPQTLLKEQRDCDWLGGAFMFIRRAALEKVGPHLDESFFFYGEDIEFCHRFHRAGYRVHYDPAVAITHVGGSSSDPTRVPQKQRNAYMWQARYLVQKKCYGMAAACAVRVADVLAFALKRLKLLVTGKWRTEIYRNVSESLVLILSPMPRAQCRARRRPTSSLPNPAPSTRPCLE